MHCCPQGYFWSFRWFQYAGQRHQTEERHNGSDQEQSGLVFRPSIAVFQILQEDKFNHVVDVVRVNPEVQIFSLPRGAPMFKGFLLSATWKHVRRDKDAILHPDNNNNKNN